MSEREAILGRVKEALAPLHTRAPLPDFEADLAVVRKVFAGKDLVQAFTERLLAVQGEVFLSAGALAERLVAGGWTRGYCDPDLLPLFGDSLKGLQVETTFDRSRIDDYAFGITKASGGVAETGTLILKDRTTSRRLAALAPWVHVAVLSRKDMFSDLTQAVAAFGDDPNVIWCTGPSKTADVEGILIQGVHGPGAQFALILD
jgi:L-lactate dehydrogenase complex protein LldG